MRFIGREQLMWPWGRRGVSWSSPENLIPDRILYNYLSVIQNLEFFDNSGNASAITAIFRNIKSTSSRLWSAEALPGMSELSKNS